MSTTCKPCPWVQGEIGDDRISGPPDYAIAVVQTGTVLHCHTHQNDVCPGPVIAGVVSGEVYHS